QANVPADRSAQPAQWPPRDQTLAQGLGSTCDALRRADSLSLHRSFPTIDGRSRGVHTFGVQPLSKRVSRRHRSGTEERCHGMGEERDNNAKRAARRAFLQALVAMGSSVLVARQSRAADEANPASEKRPQPGDHLVFSEGEREGTIVAAADVKSGN